jgi:hypothetical protein
MNLQSEVERMMLSKKEMQLKQMKMNKVIMSLKVF